MALGIQDLIFQAEVGGVLTFAIPRNPIFDAAIGPVGNAEVYLQLEVGKLVCRNDIAGATVFSNG